MHRDGRQEQPNPKKIMKAMADTYIQASLRAEELKKIDYEQQFIDEFLRHQGDFFVKHHNIFHNQIIYIIEHVVERAWVKAADMLLHRVAVDKSAATSVWGHGIRRANSVEMANVFLTYPFSEHIWWLNSLARYPNVEVFERCFLHMMEHHPTKVDMGGVVEGVVKEGNLDKMRVIEDYMTDDLKTHAINISCTYNNAFIVDFWYKPHLGVLARDYILANYDHLMTEGGYVEQGLAYLNSLLHADELVGELSQHIDAKDHLGRKASKI